MKNTQSFRKNVSFDQTIQNSVHIFEVDLFVKQTYKYNSYNDNEEDEKARNNKLIPCCTIHTIRKDNDGAMGYEVYLA